ncbi:MAG: O-antigen ligase family protein [Pseudoclavibacter sp.]
MTVSETTSTRRGIRAWLRGGLGDPERGDNPWHLAFAAFAIFTGFAGDFWRNLASWYGFGVVALAVLVLAVVVLAKKRPLPRWHHLPLPLLLFMVWCLTTALWSEYVAETLLTSALQIITVVIGLAIAVTLTRPMLLRAISLAMRAIVAMSLVFEVIVEAFFPDGVFPLYMLIPGQLEMLTGVPGATIDTAPPGFKWSQGHIFSGAAIQGVVGNRNLLAMIALLAAIAVAVQLMSKQIGRWNGLIWLAASLGTVALSRSMTVVVACGVVAFAALLVWIARPLRTRHRWMLYGAVFVAMLACAAVVLRFHDTLFGLINRSSDMSGRGDIWWAVTQLAWEHWLGGLGWISYWAPWVEPFKGMLVVDGVQYLQAHNAYIDVWMQTGVIGVVLFALLVITTLIRTWWLAIDSEPNGQARIPQSAMLAFLVVVALTVQSLTESRLLVEGNWLLLSSLAISSKLRVQDLPALPRRTLPAMTGPITVIDASTLQPRSIPPTEDSPIVGDAHVRDAADEPHGRASDPGR